MYKIKWNKNNNGLILSNKINDEDIISPPRPVFHQELNLLGFDKFWKYPKTENPLFWAIGRNYFYKGEKVAKVNGGNIYNSPKIEILKQNFKIEPINIAQIIKNNESSLWKLENEAIDFISDTFVKYKQGKNNLKADFIVVAFSGGKDSQVILDLVSRVIPPEDYIIVFTDTTIELPYTLQTVEQTKEIYKKKYPSLKI